MGKKEYIERWALIEKLNNKVKTDYEMGLYNHGALTESFIRFVERQHTADVVEVVRCKDCRFCRNLPNGLCYAWTEPYDNDRGYKGEVHCVEPDDFCSSGERKEQT